MAMQVQGPIANNAATSTQKPILIGGNNPSDNLIMLEADANGILKTVPIAGELHVGEVSNPITIVDVNPTLDTAAYASGDVLFVSTVCTNAFRVTDGLGVLNSITIIDQADQGVAFDLYFFDTNVTTGAFNGAPSISDADALTCLAIIPIATADWKDLGGVRVCNIKNIWATVKAATGTRNMYMAAVNGSGTPTFAASSLRFRLGILPS